MKTNRRIHISFLDENSELGSIIQVMSEETIGKWINYLLDQEYSLISVKEIQD